MGKAWLERERAKLRQEQNADTKDPLIKEQSSSLDADEASHLGEKLIEIARGTELGNDLIAAGEQLLESKQLTIAFQTAASHDGNSPEVSFSVDFSPKA